MSALKRVLIMAGGTGGHVFPGLAIANYLREQNVEVHWLGTHQGLEARVVPAANIPLHFISITGLRGKGLKSLLHAPIKITQAIRQSRRILKQIQPDVVIGLGGFVSGPGGIASWLQGIPLVIHEQNAKAGLTNQLLSRVAKKVLEGFPDTFKARSKVVTVGNPVRIEIESLPSPDARFAIPHAPYRLLILGGSLGAKALNELVPRAVAKLPAAERPMVWHQSGDKHFSETQKQYQSIGLQVILTPFIEDMAKAYEWADLVICRAGALTVAELCAAGVGAMFVPFPHAVDDHQTANADFMVRKNAAFCIQQAALTEDRLADIVREFSRFPEKRFNMAKAAYALRRTHVTEEIFGILSAVVSEEKLGGLH